MKGGYRGRGFEGREFGFRAALFFCSPDKAGISSGEG